MGQGEVCSQLLYLTPERTLVDVDIVRLTVSACRLHVDAHVKHADVAAQ